MINTTMAYKKAVEKNRHFRIRDTIFLDDGEQLTLSMEDVTAYSINEATSSDGKFEIGAAIVKEYKISLNNMDGVFDGIGFEGADVSAIIGLRLQDGTWEDLRKGQFRVVEAKARELTIDIRAYDAMLFFDRPYSESSMEYPASINQILIDACRVCQMTFNARTVQMGDYVVKKRPDDQALTFRDVISFCAQIMGCYAYINNLGQLEFGWYDFDALKFLRDGRYDGGIFDKNMPYLSGDAADGGNFLRWEEGDILDGGEFADMNAYHHIYLLKSKSVNTDDITITGVSISFKDNSGKEELLMYGNEGYVLELSGNPLIQENAGQVLQHVGEKVTGNTFRPMNVTTQSDPSMEAGDLAVVTDRKQRSYWTVITNTTFSLSGSQKIECSAETPAEKNYTRYGAVTKIVSETKKQAENQLSAYEISSRQFNDLMARSMGLYETYEKQEDGSIIKYQHDKPNLSESKTIWKQAGGAFGVSTDGGKTWNAGTDAEGNALFNVLATVGFYFDWAQGGTLTLGGDGNKKGTIVMLGDDGEEYGSWTNEGLKSVGDLEIRKYYAGKKKYYEAKIDRFDNIRRKGIIYSLYGMRVGTDIRNSTTGYGEMYFIPLNTDPGYDGPRENMIYSNSGLHLVAYKYPENEADPKESAIDLNGRSFRIKADNLNVILYDPYGGGPYPANLVRFPTGIVVENTSVFYNPENTTSGYAAQLEYSGDRNSFYLKKQSSSSVRYKVVEREMNADDVESLYNISPVFAKYKEEYLSDGDERYGIGYPMLIAEDVEKYAPLAVDHNEHGQVENWNHRVLIPYMFQMIKIQKDRITNLEGRIKKLEELMIKGDR